MADTLSRVTISAIEAPLPPPVDFEALAKAQGTDSELKTLQDSTATSLQLATVPHLTAPITLVCDVSKGTPRPFVPLSFRRTVFHSLHSLSHPGVRAS